MKVKASEKPEYVSIRILQASYSDWKQYLKKKRRSIVAVWAAVLAISLAASFIIPKKYTATLSFALQNEEAGGGLSDLASQFGLSLGGGAMGAFGGDNLFELLQSRLMLERALLKEETIDGRKTNLLNLYLDTYRFPEKWQKSKKPELLSLSFPVEQPRATFSRTQDSIVQVVTALILKKQLSVEKRNKKLSIGDIAFTSENERLSKMFVENLMEVTGNYYIQTKTKRSYENYMNLKHEVDSIRLLYTKAIHSQASAVDSSPNAVRQRGLTGVVERTTEMQYLAATYAEMQKNLELARVSMNTNAPLIDVIDAPIYPLKVTKYGKLKAIVIGLFLGGVVSFMLYSSLFFYKEWKRSRRRGEPAEEPLAAS